jgi:hypothetical protein
MLSGTGGGLGGGVQSTAVCRGPYSHVTSESFNLFVNKGNKSINNQIGCATRFSYQLSVSGEIVFSLFLCFHQVLQEAFSRRMPFVISFF